MGEMPVCLRMCDAALRKSRLGRWPLAPSETAGPSVIDMLHPTIEAKRTKEETNVREGVMRVVEIEGSPDGTSGERKFVSDEICEWDRDGQRKEP